MTIDCVLVGGPQDGLEFRTATEPAPRVQRFGDPEGEHDHYYLLDELKGPGGRVLARYGFLGHWTGPQVDAPQADDG